MDATVPLAVTARIQNNGHPALRPSALSSFATAADEFIEKFVEAMAAVPTVTRWTPRRSSVRS